MNAGQMLLLILLVVFACVMLLAWGLSCWAARIRRDMYNVKRRSET
jgi:hypothetical protein